MIERIRRLNLDRVDSLLRLSIIILKWVLHVLVINETGRIL